MRTSCALATLGLVLASGGVAPRSGLPLVRANANTERAGVLHDGVLTVALEAKESAWHLDGPDRPPTTIEAFSEPGQPPLMFMGFILTVLLVFAILVAAALLMIVAEDSPLIWRFLSTPTWMHLAARLVG